MGQYFDFGDQVGGLIGEALNRAEQSRQFNERQAMEYVQLQQVAERWKAEQTESRARFDLTRGDSIRADKGDKALSLRKQFVDEDAVKVLFGGKIPKGLTGMTAEQIEKPIDDIYGGDFSALPTGRKYFDKDLATEAYRSLKLQEQINAQMPKVIRGTESIPIPTPKFTSTERTIPLSILGRDSKFAEELNRRAQKGFGKAVITDEVLRNELASRIPDLRLNPNDQLEYDQDTQMLSVVPVDQSGLPVRHMQTISYDENEVKAFMGAPLKAMTDQLNSMNQLDRQRASEQVEFIASRLRDIVQNNPAYVKAVQPWMPEMAAAEAKNSLRLAQIDNANNNAKKSQSIQALKSMIANGTPEEKREALNQMMLITLQ